MWIIYYTVHIINMLPILLIVYISVTCIPSLARWHFPSETDRSHGRKISNEECQLEKLWARPWKIIPASGRVNTATLGPHAKAQSYLYLKYCTKMSPTWVCYTATGKWYVIQTHDIVFIVSSQLPPPPSFSHLYFIPSLMN